LDPDDVPSATLALLLEAFYLSNDSDALRAVYGQAADLTEHDRWLQVLRLGGDVGELGRMLQLAINIAGLLGRGLASGVKRLVRTVGPWGVVPLGVLALVVLMRAPETTRLRLKSAAASGGPALANVP
jgi:hypothetical protein